MPRARVIYPKPGIVFLFSADAEVYYTVYVGEVAAVVEVLCFC